MHQTFPRQFGELYVTLRPGEKKTQMANVSNVQIRRCCTAVALTLVNWVSTW